jgi:hypothetical protein
MSETEIKCGGGEMVMVMETSEMTMIGKHSGKREWHDDSVENEDTLQMVIADGKVPENAFQMTPQ